MPFSKLSVASENVFQESAIPQTLPSAWNMAFWESALRACTERATSIMTFRKVPFPKPTPGAGILLVGKVLSRSLFAFGKCFSGSCHPRNSDSVWTANGAYTDSARYVYGTCSIRTSHGSATYRTLPTVRLQCAHRERTVSAL